MKRKLTTGILAAVMALSTAFSAGSTLAFAAEDDGSTQGTNNFVGGVQSFLFGRSRSCM